MLEPIIAITVTIVPRATDRTTGDTIITALGMAMGIITAIITGMVIAITIGTVTTIIITAIAIAPMMLDRGITAVASVSILGFRKSEIRDASLTAFDREGRLHFARLVPLTLR